MLKVISFGEALVDMLSNHIGGATDAPEAFTKFPGGAPANVAATVGLLGAPSYMVGKIGNDMFGHFMRQSLQAAQVNTDYLLETNEAHTALAFVSLDETGERSFTFYRNPSADMLYTADEYDDACFDNTGIFHLCSNTLTAEGIKAATMAGIEKAQANNVLISFDVNLRTNLWPEGADPLPPIWEVLEQADLIKLSVEEMEFLCQGVTEAQVIERMLSHKAQLILLTDGGAPLRYITRQGEGQVTPPKTTMVDSTAAGDCFIGGFLFKLAHQDVTTNNFVELCNNTAQLESSLVFATHCGAHAVSKKGAFTSLPTMADLPEAVRV